MFTKKFLLCVVCALLLSALHIPNAWAVEYRIRDLGAYGASSKIIGLSGAGDVFTWYREGDVEYTDYFLRSKLDGTTTRTAVPSGFPRGVSDSGLVVTDFGCFDAAGSYTYMGNELGYRSSGSVINDRGDIAGANDADDYLRVAFRWTQSTGFESLGLLPGKEESFAHAINNMGQVVGESSITVGQQFQTQGFRWTPGIGMEALPSLPDNGESRSSAHGINDLGQVAGWSSDMDAWGDAVYWDVDGSVHDLGSGRAYDINNLGYVVGYNSGKGILWTPDGNSIELPSLFNNNNCKASFINDSGIIAGMENDGTDWHIVVWEPVPEPSCLAVLLSGVGFAALRRRSR